MIKRTTRMTRRALEIIVHPAQIFRQSMEWNFPPFYGNSKDNFKQSKE